MRWKKDITDKQLIWILCAAWMLTVVGILGLIFVPMLSK